MDKFSELNEIFKEVFDDNSIEISYEKTADDIDGWDSLSHVNLILAIEDHFNITFDQKELLSFTNVGELFESIMKKISD